MSNTVNTQKTYLYQDGDAYRAPKGTAIPSNPFGATPTTGTGPGVVWDAFGGIQAGFETDPKRDINKKYLFNKRDSAAKVTKGPKENSMKFRAVQFSKATVLTSLMGGSITETSTGSGVWKWVEGVDETFALMWVLDGEASSLTDRMGFYCSEVTLGALPPRKTDGEDMEGFDFTLEALAPIIPISNFNPLV
ncbi:hypothetical protein [Jatrophihabitans endophyticus]|uniref:hypothetical protein n=1 Tax=Jatrophihabitans endophyticus TaxID=1206085 RepID=UPI0019DBC935|nr:hypothetical protein [Jatrophihabitans endophyticus]MBE7190704.1 hypothetical protein [Jatrophihabitans endophyticus]